jgi:hypothetical protein
MLKNLIILEILGMAVAEYPTRLDKSLNRWVMRQYYQT